ncbi:hypothetical protein KC866_01035 [Patescibacteria group bacterium]|nr:hypothetical protein [Patescibacteria group bacterium]
MPIVHVTYDTRDGFRTTLKNLDSVIKSVLGIDDYILHCHEKGEFDKTKAPFHIEITLSATKEREERGGNRIATEIQDALNTGFNEHYVLLNLGGELYSKYF